MAHAQLANHCKLQEFSSRTAWNQSIPAYNTAKGSVSCVQDFTFVFAEFDKAPVHPIPSASLSLSTLDCDDFSSPLGCHLQT